MATAKTYNSIDSKEQLMLVETGRGTFGGYKQELLVNSLNEIEVEFYVCTECRGVMLNACQLGEEQIPVCETCVGDRTGCQSMMKARKKILELKVNCPLATRGCLWNATLSEVEAHLDECQEFIVDCELECGVILKRCEQENHCSNECLNRLISCEHCQAKIAHRDLKQHYEVCLEFPLLCPNNCGANLRRKQTDPHIETDCPNAIVKCRYERFGCREVVRRCEMDNHNKTNEIKHLEMGTFFAADEIGQLKETNSRLTERIEQQERTILMLTEELERQERTISQQKGTLEKVIQSLTYPVVLRDNIHESYLGTTGYYYFTQPESTRKQFSWQSHKLELQFKYTGRDTDTIFVLIRMANGGSMEWLQRDACKSGFKLTIIDRVNTNNSLIYEMPVMQLKEQSRYELEITSIPKILLFEKRFRGWFGEIEYILQIQDLELIRILNQSQRGLRVKTDSKCYNFSS